MAARNSVALSLLTLASCELVVHRPNLIYILNDDTDVLLGSASTLWQTRALLADKGAEFTQFRTLSPKCTPSRTGQLVGRHYHNVRPRGQILDSWESTVTVEEDGLDYAPPPGGGLNQSTMFESTALFPQLIAAGYWTSIVGKVHNGQKSFLCTPGHNRTAAFTHVGTLCSPCGNYWGSEYVVKEPGEPTTRMEKIDGDAWSGLPLCGPKPPRPAQSPHLRRPPCTRVQPTRTASSATAPRAPGQGFAPNRPAEPRLTRRSRAPLTPWRAQALHAGGGGGGRPFLRAHRHDGPAPQLARSAAHRA